MRISIKGINEALRTLDARKVILSAQMAVNDSARQTRAEAARVIYQIYNLPKSRINAEVRNVSFATTDDLKALIRAQGKAIGLMNFGATWTRNVAGKARKTDKKKSTFGKRVAKETGVKYKPYRGQAPTLLRHSFIGRGRAGRTDGAGSLQVFRREDLANNKSAVVNQAMIKISSMMAQPKVFDATKTKAEEVLERRFWHHLKREW